MNNTSAAMGQIAVDLQRGTISGSFPVGPDARSALMATFARLMVALSDTHKRAKNIELVNGQVVEGL